MDGLQRDFAFAWRRLRMSPVFTVFAVATLALGIGVTTSTYSIVRVVTGPPAGVRDVDRLVIINHTARGGSLPLVSLSWPDYQDYKQQQTTLEAVAAFTFFRQAFAANGLAETAFGEAVSGEYFQVLGVTATLGRVLTPLDDQASATPVAVISHGVWRRLFGGAPDVVGRAFKLNGNSFEIVGVAHSDFQGLFNNGLIPTGVWIPLSSTALLPSYGLGSSSDRNERNYRWLSVRGRLKNNHTLAQAQAEATTIARQLDAAFPIGRDLDARFRSPHNVSRPWTVRLAKDLMVNEGTDTVVRPLAVTLVGVVTLVLLIACTNLTNLMLARSSGRRHEIAVRLAMGASRMRLLREELAESVIVAALGGALGLGVARALLVVLGNELHVGNGATLRLQPTIDLFVLTLAAAATLLALAVAGLMPAAQSARTNVRSTLATDGPSTGAPRWRGRRVLIAMQVSVSVILLAVAALCINQVRRQQAIDSGIDLDRIAVAEVDFDMQSYDEQRVRQIVDAVLGAVGREGRVEAVAVSSGLPVGVTTPGASVRATEQSGPAAVELMAATPGIFRVIGVSVVAGRAFDDRDHIAAQRVAVINESTAITLFGTSDAVGRQMIVKRRRWVGMDEPVDEAVTIVGVAADTDTGVVGRRDRGTVYLPLAQHYEARLVFSTRSPEPEQQVATLRRAIRAVDPDIAISQAGTGAAIAGPYALFLQVLAGLATVLGGFALVLALAGLFGALSHIVAGRTHEIGVRLALGATPRQITRMIVVDGLQPVASGVVLGLAIGWLARMSLTPLFVRLMPSTDLFTLAVVPALIGVAALVACHLPARRAARVDPNVALRNL